MSTVGSTSKRENVNQAPDSRRLWKRLQSAFSDFPFPLTFRDHQGVETVFGHDGVHWHQSPLVIHLKTRQAETAAEKLDGLWVLELFRNGQIDFHGNLYLLSEIRDHLGLKLSLSQLLGQVLRANLLQFQNFGNARKNVKTHYDIPQEVIDLYLDRVYMSYSCAMFENPHRFDIEAMVRPGRGQSDDYDSLEKAQWRKYSDAVAFLEARPGDTLLDVGCGYGGQLDVALDHEAFDRVVGWTLSSNQAREGRKLLSRHEPCRWELNEGDYRTEERVFDHVTSTGMISHVGPRGLVPYVRNVRGRIRLGGRYVHHAIMARNQRSPLDAEVGVAFNKRYVWPGFHWFTIGQHIRALERNGFTVTRAVNLSPHYAKTVAAWYERMMLRADEIKQHMGENAFRAWQVYLAGGSQTLLSGRGHVYRVYCQAV